MTQKLRWFDRKFSFAFEVEIYPSIVERLRGLMPRLHAKLELIDHQILTRREGDTWSIQENIGHLLDLEALWYKRIDDFFAKASTLSPADLKNKKTHNADHNATPLTSIVASLSSDRQRLIDRLDQLRPEDFGRTAKHPRLDQPMRLVDLALFVAEHDDHHLARITELAL